MCGGMECHGDAFSSAPMSCCTAANSTYPVSPRVCKLIRMFAHLLSLMLHRTVLPSFPSALSPIAALAAGAEKLSDMLDDVVILQQQRSQERAEHAVCCSRVPTTRMLAHTTTGRACAVYAGSYILLMLVPVLVLIW